MTTDNRQPKRSGPAVRKLIEAAPRIRLAIYAGEERGHFYDRNHRYSRCAFCLIPIIDRNNVGEEEPPAACPSCTEYWNQTRDA